MVIWKNVIKVLLKASIFTIIIPIMFVTFVIAYFGISTSAVLCLVMFAQLYLMWAQIEVLLRQSKMNQLMYEPYLIIETKQTYLELPIINSPINIQSNKDYFSLEIKIKNIGNYPAYSLFVHPLKPLPSSLREKFTKFIPVLPPGQENALGSITFQELEQINELVINIDYHNLLDDYNGMVFVLKKDYVDRPIIAHGRRRMPGILLNSIEDLSLVIKLLTDFRRTKKRQKVIKMLKEISTKN